MKKWNSHEKADGWIFFEGSFSVLSKKLALNTNFYQVCRNIETLKK